MASLLLAAVFMAPLTYFAAIFIPLVWIKDLRTRITMQIVGIIVAVGLWVGIHHLAGTLYPAWGFAMTATNVLLAIFAAMVLAFIGANDIGPSANKPSANTPS